MPNGFFSGGGKMGQAVLNNDWSTHELGQPDSWPQNLKTTLGICFHSPFPMAVYWGKDMHLFYNDAWVPIIGDKHPAALGKPAKEVWSDIWNVIGPAMDAVFVSGKGTISQKTLLPMYRRGYIEEAYFDYTINPVFGEKGSVDGLLIVASEVTGRVLAQRRNTLLHKMSESTVTAESPEAACIIAANTLGEAPYDISFARIYLVDEKETCIRIAADTSIDDAARMHTIDLSDNKRVLPYAEVIHNRKSQVVYNVDASYRMSSSVWPEKQRHVTLLPVIRSVDNTLFGLIVVGISPRLFYDQAYEHFLNDIAERIAFSIGNAIDVQHKIILSEREQRAQQQLSAALSSGLIGVWSWDVKKNLVITDSNMALLYGLEADRTKKGLKVEEFLAMIHPEDRPRLEQKIEKSLTKHTWLEDEYRIVGPDNTVRWVLARGTVELDSKGTVVQFPGVVVDITERKKIEEELANSEQIFKSLFDSSIMGMSIASLDGTIHDANNAFLRMFGYTRRDLAKGITSRMLTPPGSIRATQSLYKSLRETGEAKPVNKLYLRKDGTVVPGLVGGVMMAGAKNRFISFILDLSEQAHLRELNQAKDEFISIASHQLRTPATGVKQYLGMMLEGYAGNVTDKQRALLQTAYASNERQLIIVNDLLRVAQADAKEVQLTKESVDVVSLIQDVINEQAVKFAEKSQEVRFKTTRKAMYAYVDSFYIRMALENIIDNAHKYTPDGKSISISVRKKSADTLEISVEDEGVGIQKRDLPKLFKKFSRINNPLSMSAGGTGLGLYWVQKIIKLHSGSIRVNSVYKHGTSFVITLPSGISKPIKR